MPEYEVVAPQSCILFATADWDEPYWTNKQHCAKSLAELGTKVLYVESVGLRRPKAGSARDWNRLWNRLRKGVMTLILGPQEPTPGIYVLSPLLVPAGHRHAFTRAINRLLLKLTIDRAVRQHRFEKPLIWTYHPYMLDVIDRIDKGPLLYHCVDDLAAVPGVDATGYRATEQELLQRADVVFATSPSLTEHCLQHNPNSHFLSNVVDAEHFGRAQEPGPIPDDLACIPEPRLCYHGVLSDFKIDFQLLLDAARMKPEWSWIFIGEERAGQQSPIVAELAKLPNAHFLGYRSYAVLPDYLRGMQAGLLPLLINDYTKGMFPMKYYEYVAAGLPVVATPLDFIRGCRNTLGWGADSAEFVAAAERGLNAVRATAKETETLVGDNTWQARCQTMLQVACVSTSVSNIKRFSE